MGGFSNISVYDNERLFAITLRDHSNVGFRVSRQNNNGGIAIFVISSIDVCLVSL